MPRAKLELRIGFLLNIRFYAYISMVQYLGAARLELAKTEVERFTVSCNCRYATPPKNCWRKELNPQPSDYKSGALPIELHQQNER